MSDEMNNDKPEVSEELESQIEDVQVAEVEPGISPIRIEDEMENSFIDYSMSVIVARALPDVRDGLKPMNDNKVYGKIFTAKTNTDDWGTSLMAMDNAEKGEVLFIYTYGKPASVWGELASTCAGEKGIAGTVLYGWARDMDALVDLDYPVFALDYLPNAGKALGLGEINIDLEIDDDIIKPGDFVFGDQNGVVVIPKELFHETMVATFNVKVKESHIIKELKKGRLLSEIIGLNR